MKTFAKRLLRPLAGRPRTAPAGPAALTINAGVGGGWIDTLVIHGDGTVDAEGWTPDLSELSSACALRIDGRLIAPTHAFRVHRPAVPAPPGGTPFQGAVVEWVLPAHPVAQSVELVAGGATRLAFSLPPIVEPAYGGLRTETRVLGRDHIYCFGPPVHEVSADVLALARTLPTPILDFGCGGGALVRALRREGLEAFGLELNEPRIQQHLLDEVRPLVTLYDGRFPAPFPDGRFASVVSSEVLEHIPGPDAALAEMARLASRALLVAVPDMSAIPRGFPHGVVPWHLLESTHVNFFTQASLEHAIATHTTRFEMSRINPVVCGALKYYGSLAVVARLSD
jgi:hypothetical protein